MSDEQRVEVHGIKSGTGDYTGESFTALPIVVHADRHEQADERIAPFYLACIELAKGYEGIEVPIAPPRMMECFDNARLATATYLHGQDNRN